MRRIVLLVAVAAMVTLMAAMSAMPASAGVLSDTFNLQQRVVDRQQAQANDVVDTTQVIAGSLFGVL